tara:strand:- start:27210 stop:29420 length:2211 start_codon:yes stop_codon:yes gene_type:complete
MDNVKKTFGISQNSKMFRILSDQMYSDKPGAIIRELGCNAWDSHVAAGRTDVPFTVHAPNMLEPWLAITDVGIGLSHDDIMNLYTTYGESTKNNSNDFIGALGLGSKSPFAYTDTFTISSVFNNELRVYNAFINSDGEPTITQVGGVIPSNNHNGISIQLPVKNEDNSKFSDAVTKYYSYFPTPPTITGAAIELTTQDYTLSGDGWGMSEGGRRYATTRHVALMGNVPYPIDLDNLGVNSYGSPLSSFLSAVRYFNVRLDFELGELDVAASREALSYDGATVSAITARYKEVQGEVLTTMKAQIEACDTLYDACLMFVNSYKMRQVIGDDTKMFWKGQEVTANIHIDLADSGIGEVVIKHISHSTLRNRKTLNLSSTSSLTYYRPLDGNTLAPSNYIMFPVHTSGQKTIVLTRDINTKAIRMPSRIMAAYKAGAFGIIPSSYNDTNISILLMEGTTKDINLVLKKVGNVPNVVDFFDMCPDIGAPSRVASTQGRAASAKVLTFGRSRVSHWGVDSEYWTKADDIVLDSAKGYYLDTRSSLPHFKGSDDKLQLISNEKLANLMRSLSFTSLLEDDFKFYGIPGSYKNLMPAHPHWDCLIYTIITQLNSLAKTNKYRNLKLASTNHEGFRASSALLRKMKGKVTLDKEFNELVKTVNNSQEGHAEYTHLQDLVKTLEGLPNLPVKLKLDTPVDPRYTREVFDRYPMLQLTTEFESAIKTVHVVDYVDTMYKLNKGVAK